MKRYAKIGRLQPGGYDAYKHLHDTAWPEVLTVIKACNLRNYSIYHHDGLLFSYFEYVGDDFETDMAKMAADATTQKWWAALRPSLETWGPREDGVWWMDAEELFHQD